VGLPDRLSKAAAHENNKTLSRLPPFLPEGSSFGSSLTSSAAFLSSLSPRNTGWPSRSSRVHSVNLTSQTIDGSIQGQHFISATVNPGSNGAKIRSFWDGFAPGGATGLSPGLSPGFQPWEPQNKRVRPHKAHECAFHEKHPLLRVGDAEGAPLTRRPRKRRLGIPVPLQGSPH
jgi:hypothetical protein